MSISRRATSSAAACRRSPSASRRRRSSATSRAPRAPGRATWWWCISSGGNDALSTVVPYQDPFYYSRRPTIAVPAGQVLQIGTDSSGKALGLHPRLTGPARDIQRGAAGGHAAHAATRTPAGRTSRGWTSGARRARARPPAKAGWAATSRPLPADPLVGWAATQELPRALSSREVSVPAIPNAATYAFNSPNAGAEALNERAAATRDRVAPARRAPEPGVREHQRAGGVRDAGSRRLGGQLHRHAWPIPTTASRRRCGRWRARSCATSARACSGCRPAASIRTRSRAPAEPAATAT